MDGPQILKLFLVLFLCCWMSPGMGADTSAKSLREVVSCALERSGVTPERKIISLAAFEDLIPRLVRGFDHYQLTSRTQKAHFLAQAMHETYHFTAMVRRAFDRRSRPPWDRALAGLLPGSARQCDSYLEALENDRDNYRNWITGSAFRPRGLLQVEGCANYLGFFHHKNLEREGTEDVAQKKMRTSFHYRDEGGQKIKVGHSCSPRVLEELSRNFPLPEVLVENAEMAMDELSLPCQGRGIEGMESVEFLVDSALWFWRRCQKKFPRSVEGTGSRSVAFVSKCIQGNPRHDRFDASWCHNGNPSAVSGSRGDTVLIGYCRRLHYFQALHHCFESVH